VHVVLQSASALSLPSFLPMTHLPSMPCPFLWLLPTMLLASEHLMGSMQPQRAYPAMVCEGALFAARVAVPLSAAQRSYIQCAARYHVRRRFFHCMSRCRHRCQIERGPAAPHEASYAPRHPCPHWEPDRVQSRARSPDAPMPLFRDMAPRAKVSRASKKKMFRRHRLRER